MNKSDNSQSWTFGANKDSDVWIDHPEVSGSHCRLVRTVSGYRLVDLNSTNGTFVDGSRVDSANISLVNHVMLAGTVPMPWPDELQAQNVIEIGSAKSNTIVLEHASVAAMHARLIIDPHGQMLLKDLGSSNGTWIGDRAIKMAAITPHTKFRLGAVELDGERAIKFSNENQQRSISRVAILLGAGLVAFLALGLMFVSVLMLVNRKAEATPEDGRVAVVTTGDPQPAVPPDVPNTTPPVVEPMQTGTAPNPIPMPANELPASKDDSPPAETIEEPPKTDDQPPQEISPITVATRPYDASLFLIAVKVDGVILDLATAWSATPLNLITSAGVIKSIQDLNSQSIQEDGSLYDQVIAVNLASGEEFQVSGFFSHPIYTAQRQKIAELQYKLNELDSILKPSKAAQSSSPIMEARYKKARAESAELNNRRFDIQLMLSSYDIAWVQVATPIPSKSPLINKRTAVVLGQKLKLVCARVRKEDPYYFVGRRPEVIELEVLRETLRLEQSPGRWVCKINSDSADHFDYVLEGSPIFDVAGNFVGTCRSAGQQTSASEATAAPEQKIEPLGEYEIEMVPFDVIGGILKQFDQE